MSSFYVYLQSDVKPGYAKDLVRNNIANALKLSKAQAGKLLNKEVILKKGVDHETADNYVKRFAQFGAICRIEDKSVKDSTSTVDNVVTEIKLETKHCLSCEIPIQGIAQRCQYCGFNQSDPIEKPEQKPTFILPISVGIAALVVGITLYFIML